MLVRMKACLSGLGFGGLAATALRPILQRPMLVVSAAVVAHTTYLSPAICAKGSKGKSTGKAAVAKQQNIQDTLQPLLPKPTEMKGETLKVPGAHWGSACDAAERAKLFVCTILDFSFIHRFTPQDAPTQVFQLSERGEDGHGGNSVDFWMKYPQPFLQYWYATYPEKLSEAKGQTASKASEAVLADASDETAGGGGADPRSEAWRFVKVLKVNHIKGGKQNGRKQQICECNIVEFGKPCKRPITVYGNSTTSIFKHARLYASKAGNDGHAEALAILNQSSCAACTQMSKPKPLYSIAAH